MRISVFALALLTFASQAARAQEERPPREVLQTEKRPDPTITELASHAQVPPPLHIPYLQYGVALTGEFVASPGPICNSTRPAPNTPPACILNSGGGVALRVGYRAAGPFYLGGAYEVSKQDPNNLYRLAILQQLRAEVRYYFENGRDLQPVLLGGAGAAGYGNQWSIDTWGPMGFLGAGLEYQVTRRTVLEASVSYRLIMLKAMTDTSGTARDGGVASLIGLEVGLAQRDPL
jgi:hypothetical protein